MDIYQQLKQHEGWRTSPYKDSEGNWTWGCGHLMADPFCDAAIDAQLKADVLDAVSRLNHLKVFRDLGAAPNGYVRQMALVNMCFNLGYYKLLGFHTMWDRLEHGDFGGAAKAALESKWAEQVKGRAQQVAHMIETGEWPES